MATRLCVWITAAMLSGGVAIAGSGDGDASTRLFLSEAVERIVLSAKLAAVGRQERDPIALLGAARLLNWARPSFEPLKMDIRGGTDDEPGATSKPSEHSLSELMNEARAMASDDQALLAVIEGEQRKFNTLPGSGPTAHRQLLARGATASVDVRFMGRQGARVAVVGQATSNLDLVILDYGGKPVCEARAAQDIEFCEWLPARDASFTLVVENRGPRANTFTIYMN